MKSPTPGRHAEARGGGAAWRRIHRLHTANHSPFPHHPTRPAGALRDMLTAAAKACQHGDHGAAEYLETLALVALRHLTARPEVRV